MTNLQIFPLSRNEETDEQPISLSLRGLMDALAERGVQIGYSTLSELIATGDIAEQIGAGGTGSRREFHPDVAPVMAEFIREYKRARGKTPQAPAMLRSFLKQRMSGGGETGSEFGELSKQVSPVAIAEAQGRAEGLALTERVLTAQEAADVLHISVRMLRHTVPPYRRFGESPKGDRWLFSDLLKRQ